MCFSEQELTTKIAKEDIVFSSIISVCSYLMLLKNKNLKHSFIGLTNLSSLPKWKGVYAAL